MQILETVGKENYEFQQIEYDDTESVVLQVHPKLCRELDIRMPKHDQSQQDQTVRSQGTGQNDFSGLRVPRVSVPEFSGSYLEWPSFRDLFLSMVGDNPKVPNVQKLSYLKRVIVGDTEKLIRNIKITSDNYKAAWEILQGRFENDRIIVTELLNSIYMIPNATGDANSIKLILDTTLESLRET